MTEGSIDVNWASYLEIAKFSTFGLYLKNDQGEISDRLIYDVQVFGAKNFFGFA